MAFEGRRELGYRAAWREGGWRGVGRRWVARWPRQIKPTKTGWVFFLFLVLIALIAYSTGNNLLFLLFAAMLSFFLISGFMSEASVGQIALAMEWPREWHAREAAWGTLGLQNKARRLDAYLFELRHPELFDEAEGPRIVRLAAGQGLTVPLMLRAPHRGRYTPAPFVLATSYPFLLLTKTRIVSLPDELLIFPAWRRIERAPEWLAQWSGTSASREAMEGDVDHLREWHEGEALNRVHWKRSAGFDTRLFVKELAAPRRPQVALRFCPRGASELEAGLERLASWVHFFDARGLPIHLGLDAKADWARPCPRREALTALALYAPAPDAPASPPSFVEIAVAADGTERVRVPRPAGGAA